MRLSQAALAVSVLAACSTGADQRAKRAYAAETLTLTNGVATVASDWQVPGEVDRYTVQLIQGQDYVLSNESFSDDIGRWQLGGPTGAVLCDMPTMPEGEFAGCEFRAGRTGWFTITGTAPAVDTEGFPVDYALTLATDCRAGVKTKCVIRRGQTRNYTLGYGIDHEWIRLADLVGGRYYRITHTLPTDDVPEVALLDGEGRVLASGTGASLRFRARSAVRFVRLAIDNANRGLTPYRLSLARD
jgi:hypothetical protein